MWDLFNFGNRAELFLGLKIGQTGYKKYYKTRRYMCKYT